jgi:hypothetical protein
MNIIEFFQKALPKQAFRLIEPRHSKHQASKRGHKHMSKRMPSNHHSSITIPTQHERVVAGRARKMGMSVKQYIRWCEENRGQR